jgi:hypothetical protein
VKVTKNTNKRMNIMYQVKNNNPNDSGNRSPMINPSQNESSIFKCDENPFENLSKPD